MTAEPDVRKHFYRGVVLRLGNVAVSRHAQARMIEPIVLLVADGGLNGYSNIVTAGRKIVDERPGVVKRFVDASIEGWYSFLYDDPTPANRLIKAVNPEMTDALLAYGRKMMNEHGIVDSGDALTLGISTRAPGSAAKSLLRQVHR
jgi:hypothetical protein